MQVRNKFIGLCAAVTICAGAASAGTVVVNGDEWTLSNTGFANSVGTDVFVSNMVAEFGTSIHAYSTNFGYTQSALATAMTNAGATYTTGTGIGFDLATLSAYDAIFLGGNYLSAPQLGTLSAYVSAGGNVLISGGTGWGGAAAEAAAWNPFLSPFGINLSAPYAGYVGTVSPGGDPLFAGVTSIYVNNGNTMLSGAICCSETDVFAVARIDTPSVPLPATGVLLGGAFAAVAAARRLKRRA
jgi:hypothetical protein